MKGDRAAELEQFQKSGALPSRLLDPGDPLFCKELEDFAGDLESSVTHKLGSQLIERVRSEYQRELKSRATAK